MAEERIYVFKFEDDPCKDCEVKEITPDCKCPPNSACCCLDKKEYSRGLTRQEAIERMAKAICKETNYQCSVCDFGDNKEKCEAWIYFQYKASAEAALNALLEGNNER